MNLNEAIKHLQEELANQSHDWGCAECRLEHEQLLYWLTEYRSMISGRQSDSLSERLAEHLVWAESNSYECPVTLAEDLEESIKCLRDVSGWIPCDDRLPEAGLSNWVLVSDVDGFVFMATRDLHNWESFNDGLPIDFKTITHWMPLPQPPKEVDAT